MPESVRPPSSRDVAGEDFLFHLYRGSELLQDNRVHDAKAELEQALSLQPSDPKGQDLLGIVYFRLGMYPRAIAIYERLIQMHPGAIEPRINLALSYLKTGQPAQARVELEKVIEQNPNHARAWGYLGLAFQRLGDAERASHAFAAGGHDAMAKRVLEIAAGGSLGQGADAQPQVEVRKAAGEAFYELDRTDGGFRSDAGPRRAPSGTWSAIEPGREQLPPQSALPGSLGARPSGTMPAVTGPLAVSIDDVPLPAPADAPRRDAGSRGDAMRASAPSTPPLAPPVIRAPASAAQLARELLLVFPRDLGVAVHASGLVLVQSATGFVTRLDAVRTLAYPAGWTTNLLSRRVRGKALEEPLGGPSAPLYEVTGKGEMVLGPAMGQKLVALSLDEEPIYLREAAVCGFERTVTYENGRLALGDGEAISMLQLRGPGALVAELPAATTAIEVGSTRSAAVRALAVLGWLGRVLPRALLPSEAPGGARGFVSFTGEGTVLLDAR